MARLLFTGGTLVTADGSFGTDVLVEGGTIAEAFDAWTEKAKDKALIDYGFRNLVYNDGEIVGEHGSGRFVERRSTATPLETKV
jgi:hypothetical protein